MRAAAAILLVSLLMGCGREARPEADLLPVALPDLARMDAAVQTQIRDTHAALTKTLAGNPPAADLAAAFGAMAMLLHAAEYYDAAEPAYLNAQTLAPGEPRWPYYLARLHTSKGRPEKAMAAFNRALELRPEELATLVWFGRLYLDQGQPDRAEPLLEKARSVAPRSVAALADLGQAALARRDFPRAAGLLEQALAIDPNAASIHAPLAQAYRGAGDVQKAEAHLALWRNTEIAVADPWNDQLRMALHGGMSYESRGVTALESGNFTEAAVLFRAGLAVTPHETPVGRALRHKLGLALHLGGDEAGAIGEFEEAARLAPPAGYDEQAAKAHYGLGVIHAGHGRGARAIDHLSRAVAYDPKYVQARIVLGDALLQVGRTDEALAQHREAVTIDPRATPARLGYAAALIRLRRDAEARAWLEESVRLQPNRPELRDALARLRPSSQ